MKTSNINLENMINIMIYIKTNTGIAIEKYTKYYNFILPYVEIKNAYLSNSHLLGGKYSELFKDTVTALKRELTTLNTILKYNIKDDEDKMVNIEIKNKIKAVNIIINYYNELYNTICNNSLPKKYGDNEYKIINEIISNTPILPIIMLNPKCYNYIKSKSKNIYLTLCPFHINHVGQDFTIIEGKHKWECEECNENGNIINYVSQAYHMSYYDTIETLALAYDIELPSIKTNEDKELAINIRNMLKDARYLKLIEKNIRNTEVSRKDMLREDIVLKYNYHIEQR